MSDLDLDELRCRTRRVRRSRRRRAGAPPREERIIAGFEEIQRFVEKHGRAPQHGEDRDIFERLYAVRLDRLRALEECRALLAPLDHQGLLTGAEAAAGRARRLDGRRRAAGRTRSGAAGAIRHHRTAPCPHQRRQARRRGNRQSQEVRGLRAVQAAVRAGAEASSKPASARRAPSRLQGRDQAGRASSSSAARRPMSPRWARSSRRTTAARDSRLRVIYRQRHRKRHAACARFSGRFTRTRPAAASPIPLRAAVLPSETRRRRPSQRHDLRAAQQVRPSGRRGQPRRSPQDRRDRRRGRARASPTRGSTRHS